MTFIYIVKPTSFVEKKYFINTLSPTHILAKYIIKLFTVIF